MHAEDAFRRYQELQSYVGWTAEDGERMKALGPLLEPVLPALVDDFYAEIEKHPEASKVITGGSKQVERLKGTLINWLKELFSGNYDREYVARRWRVGWRHVEIGLHQVFTNAALSRLRLGLLKAMQETWQGEQGELRAGVRALTRLLDLDLAIIEDAYQAEFSDRLQRTERLAAIGQVSGGIAHELRNPLNVVKTSVYYLLNARNATAEKKLEHLGRIEKHVAVADSVITALSNFARLPVPNLQAVDVATLLRDTLEVNPVADNVATSIECPPSLPQAFVDIDQMRIVIGNLIRNAREAMPTGGKLTLRSEGRDGHIDVQVTDTGTGIPPDQIHRIMEPLYSTKARGLGLGLAIARSILEKNNGSLSVESEAGKGSTFHVRLPAVLPHERAKG